MKLLDIKKSAKPIAISLLLGLSLLSYKNTLAQTLSDDAKIYTGYENEVIHIDDSIERLLASNYKYNDLLSEYWSTRNKYDCWSCYAQLFGSILSNDRVSEQRKIVLITIILWGNTISSDNRAAMVNDIEKYDIIYLKVLMKRLSADITLAEQEKTLAEQQEILKSLESFERLFNSYSDK